MPEKLGDGSGEKKAIFRLAEYRLTETTLRASEIAMGSSVVQSSKVIPFMGC